MPALSPISNLGEDVLWHIFNIVANLRQVHMLYQTLDRKLHPLAMIRNLSQVCFAWRRLAVESSSLWGCMIDMSVIGRVSEYWRSLIMKRTKDASLCIYGTVDGYHEGTRRFFSALLLNDWDRISQLTVYISCQERFDNSLWTIFWERPAVHLTEFKVSMTVNLGQGQAIPFKNHAPSLKTFHSLSLNVTPQASWLTGLRELSLCVHLSAPQIIDILRHTRHLERLFIERVEDLHEGLHSIESSLPNGHSSSTTALRSITLPNLRHLCIYSTLQKCISLLSQISLPVEVLRRVKVESSSNLSGNSITADDMEALFPILAQYARQFLLSHATTGFDIYILPWKLDIGFFAPIPWSNDSTSTSPFKSLFEILMYSGEDFTSASYSWLMNALSKLCLSSVKQLILLTGSGDIKVIDATDSNFQSFIFALTSVETIILTEAALDLLNGIDLDTKPAFPSLHMVKFDTVPQQVSPRLKESIKLFLSRRISLAIPLAVLDISAFVTLVHKEKLDWVFLDSFSGLTVKWTIHDVTTEYVCGTGNPNMLNLPDARYWNSRFYRPT